MMYGLTRDINGLSLFAMSLQVVLLSLSSLGLFFSFLALTKNLVDNHKATNTKVANMPSKEYVKANMGAKKKTAAGNKPKKSK